MPYKDPELQRECQREHYRNNKDYYFTRNTARKNRFRAIIRAAKNKPCVDCGHSYPFFVMDFDHREDKLFTIARLDLISSEEMLRDEIAKCDVVCANCHRIRTHQMPDGVIGSTPDFESGR